MFKSHFINFSEWNEEYLCKMTDSIVQQMGCKDMKDIKYKSAVACGFCLKFFVEVQKQLQVNLHIIHTVYRKMLPKTNIKTQNQNKIQKEKTLKTGIFAKILKFPSVMYWKGKQMLISYLHLRNQN